jgi:hypothetical protein
MKTQCDQCKEIVPLVFALVPPDIRVSCPSCGADYLVAARTDATVSAPAVPKPVAPAPAPEPEPPSADAMTCPKCGEPQKKAPACRRCGLAADKFPSWDDGRGGDPSITAGEVRSAATLFAACEERWDDTARHDAFVLHCQHAGAWAYAASLYRKQTARADRCAIATVRLADIRGLAEKALLVAVRSDGHKHASNPKRTAALLVGVAVLLIAAILLITSYFGAAARPTR